MIACADLHLTLDTPVARVDNYLVAQDNKFRTILRLAKASENLLIVAGDFFDKSCPPYELLTWLMATIDEEHNPHIVVVPGQHDLPWHNLVYLNRSGLGVLAKAGFINVLTQPLTPFIYGNYAIWPCPYGCTPTNPTPIVNKTNVLVWHHMVINKGEELWPGQDAPISGKLLRKYKEYDLVVTGDNHEHFQERSGVRKLLNSGSMMRMEADQEKHIPAVFQVENNEVTVIPLPIESDVLNREHITEQQERDTRIDEFLAKLQTTAIQKDSLVSYQNNLKQFFAVNKILKEVETTVWRCVDGG